MIWALISLMAVAILVGTAIGVVLAGEISDRTAIVVAAVFMAAIVAALSPLWTTPVGELLR